MAVAQLEAGGRLYLAQSVAEIAVGATGQDEDDGDEDDAGAQEPCLAVVPAGAA